MTVSVFISNCPAHIDKAYDYLVPPALEGEVQKGCRVMVPFGGGNAKKEGLITAVNEDGAEKGGVKPILAVIDSEPLLSDEQIRVASFVKERCFCTFFEALRLLLPAGSAIRFSQKVGLNPACGEETLRQLRENEGCRKVLDHLAACGKEVELSKLTLALGPVDRAVKTLLRCGAVLGDDGFSASVNPKTQQMVTLAMPYDEAVDRTRTLPVKRAQKYQIVIELLQENGGAPMEKSELCYLSGVGGGSLKTMESLGILWIRDYPVFADPLLDLEGSDEGDSPLSDEQQAAFDGLAEQLRAGKPSCALLKGVTGSGKTHVFLKLMEENRRLGRTALVLVPEIGLTPQMLRRFYGRFPGQVAVLHSAMSPRERFDTWTRIKNGELPIVIGTRMSVFAPLSNIGLIIMDEEQEGSYKSEASPRYHARDVAKFRCVEHNALLLLASATPSLNSYHAAKTGKYAYYELKNRYNDAALPAVTIIDMGEELRRGNDSLFSQTMVELLKQTMEKKEQAVLFLNRRGYSTFISCLECGHVLTCPNCAVSLTYHSRNDRMMCHICGYSAPRATKCPECGSEFLRFGGTGTQKVEEELSRRLPGARILRMDADTTRRKVSYYEMMQQFAAGKADILLGTQMVTKGLDFPNVTFVGILNADAALYRGDYRAAETAFSQITQVVGRAGRGQKPGAAAIQTRMPEHDVIKLGAAQDYEGFYREEIALRELMRYPPFCDLCVLSVSGPFESTVKQKAEQVCGQIKEVFGGDDTYGLLQVIGPSPAPILKVNNSYRYQILLKCRNEKGFRQRMHAFLCYFSAQPANRKFHLAVDMNPYTNL